MMRNDGEQYYDSTTTEAGPAVRHTRRERVICCQFPLKKNLTVKTSPVHSGQTQSETVSTWASRQRLICPRHPWHPPASR